MLPKILHCGEHQKVSRAYSFSLPESEDKHKAAFDYLEVYTGNCRECRQFLLGWRGVRYDKRMEPIRRLTGSKDINQMLAWAMEYSTVKVAKGVDWVWTSNKQKPFNKQKAQVR